MMGYGVVSRMFHWVTVLMVFTMIPVGIIMTQELPRSIQNPLFILHKGLGVIVLVVVLARLAWRIAVPPPPPPPGLSEFQRRAAAIVHVALYAALLVMAISGYVRVIAGGFPIELLNALDVPPLLPKNEALAGAAKSVHAATAFVLIALVAVHVGAALHHALGLRDGVMARMWPPIPQTK